METSERHERDHRLDPAISADLSAIGRCLGHIVVNWRAITHGKDLSSNALDGIDEVHDALVRATRTIEVLSITISDLGRIGPVNGK